MAMIRYLPRAPLDRYVECFWWSQRERAQVFGEHMLPSGGVQMIFALHDAPILCVSSASPARPLLWSAGILHGPQWTYFKSGPKPAGVTVGVAFRPGMAGGMLGLAVAELADRHVPIDLIWGSRARELRERLLAAQSPSAAFRVLEEMLCRRVDGLAEIHPAVKQALACRKGGWGFARVAEVQRQAGCSPRHFIAMFRAAVGMTPKHYYRVKRFTSVLQRLAGNDAGSFADLAASIGYSDQAHLTREFREFAGVSPTQYRPRDSTAILHHRSGETFSGISLG
jgi:AraC-like DNA-binding protein